MNSTFPNSKNPVLAGAVKSGTPLTIALFAVSAVTGVMLFFHIGGGPVKGIHEWLSMAFVVGAALHTLKNWRPFQNQLMRWPLWAALGLAALVTAAFLAVSGPTKEPSHGPGRRGPSFPTQTR